MSNIEDAGIGRNHIGWFYFKGIDFSLGEEANTPPAYPAGDEGYPHYSIGDNSYLSFPIPPDWQVNTDIDFTISYYVDEDFSLNNGEIAFQLDYELVPHDESEVIGSAEHSGTGVTDDLEIPTTAMTIGNADILTIPSDEISLIDECRLNLSRIATAAVSPPDAEPAIQTLLVKYTRRFPAYRR